MDAVGAGMRTASRPDIAVGHVVPVRAPFARELVARLPLVDQRRWLSDSGGLTGAARERLELVMPQIARRGWSIERLTPAPAAGGVRRPRGRPCGGRERWT